MSGSPAPTTARPPGGEPGAFDGTCGAKGASGQGAPAPRNGEPSGRVSVTGDARVHNAFAYVSVRRVQRRPRTGPRGLDAPCLHRRDPNPAGHWAGVRPPAFPIRRWGDAGAPTPVGSEAASTRRGVAGCVRPLLYHFPGSRPNAPPSAGPARRPPPRARTTPGMACSARKPSPVCSRFADSADPSGTCLVRVRAAPCGRSGMAVPARNRPFARLVGCRFANPPGIRVVPGPGGSRPAI